MRDEMQLRMTIYRDQRGAFGNIDEYVRTRRTYFVQLFCHHVWGCRTMQHSDTLNLKGMIARSISAIWRHHIRGTQLLSEKFAWRRCDESMRNSAPWGIYRIFHSNTAVCCTPGLCTYKVKLSHTCRDNVNLVHRERISKRRRNFNSKSLSKVSAGESYHEARQCEAIYNASVHPASIAYCLVEWYYPPKAFEKLERNCIREFWLARLQMLPGTVLICTYRAIVMWCYWVRDLLPLNNKLNSPVMVRRSTSLAGIPCRSIWDQLNAETDRTVGTAIRKHEGHRTSDHEVSIHL